MLLSAAATEKCINIKKGQFVAPYDIISIVNKIESSGNKKILLTERGATFGYNNLISDMRSIPIMQDSGYPVIFDATHSAQRPSGEGARSGGDREVIPVLARAAVAAGCDGIFMEIHDDIHNAKSDASTQWPLEKTEELIIKLLSIRQAIE